MKKNILVKLSILLLSPLVFTSCSSDEPEVFVNQSKKIIALWDSLTAWYWVDYEESYPYKLENILSSNQYSYEVVNAWVSWDTSSQLLERLDLYYDDELPQLALLVIWWNDWLRWKSLEDLEKNLNEIIASLKSKDIVVVLWWMKVPVNFWFKYSRDFSNIFERVAKDNDVYYMWFFLEDVALDPKLNLNDGIHPNSAWYDVISQRVFDYLEDKKLISK